METYKERDVVVMKLLPDDLEHPQSAMQELERLLVDEFERKFVADLSSLESIYSIQIGTLVSMHVLCYEHVAIMKLSGVNEKIRALLRMVGLEAMMEMHHGPAVAAQSFGAASASTPHLAAVPQKRQKHPGKPH